MMRSTPCYLGQPLCRAQPGIELITLRLGAVVLPIGGIRVGEGPSQLVNKRILWPQSAEESLCLTAPVDAPVLLARTADAPNPVHGRVHFL